MLREYAYTLNPTLITDALRKFKLDLPEAPGDLTLIEFKLLTPDSFIWKFIMSGTVYYLYAEDYVQDLDYVQHTIASRAPHSSNLKFIEVKEKVAFEDSEPVQLVDVYERSDEHDVMMKYAAGSGYDHVFLCRSDEAAEDAYFEN
jgi:hypothetical protein